MKLRFLPLVFAAACAASPTPPPATADKAPSAEPKPKLRRPNVLAGRGGAVPGQAQLDAALAAARGGKLDEVVPLTEAALEANPRLEQAYLLLGSTCALQGNDACEASAYERGLEVLPTSVALQREQGFFLLRQGKIEEGVARLEAARAAAPPAPELLADLAVAYKMAGRMSQARDTAAEAVAADARCVACYLAQGDVALFEKDFAGAEAAFASAVRNDPQNIEARRSRARAAYMGGEVDRAADLFMDLAGRAPEDVRVQVQAGQVLMVAKRPKAARDCFQAATKLLPDEPQLLEMLAQAQTASGDRAAAMATREKIRSLSRKK